MLIYVENLKSQETGVRDGDEQLTQTSLKATSLSRKTIRG